MDPNFRPGGILDCGDTGVVADRIVGGPIVLVSIEFLVNIRVYAIFYVSIGCGVSG